MNIPEKALRWGGSIVAFGVALWTYVATMEPTVSLWDCGEFIAASYKLQVVHPPGAPFFLMFNRLFTLLASNPEQVPILTNFQSALSSAASVFLLYWTVLFLLDRFRRVNVRIDGWGKVLAALTAALGFAFTDTVWFSAVETEVYALSMLLMALSFWVMLWWERRRDEPGNLRYLVLLGFLMGVAIGVHLLSLVVLPIVGLVYYFSRKQQAFSWKGLLKAFAGGMLAFAAVYVVNLRWVPWLASRADLIAVNDFGLPYWSGVLVFLVVWIAMWVGLAWYFQSRRRRPLASAVLWAYVMSLVGASSYAMVVIRSMADPPIDMNSPEDIFSLRSYLNREQYGDRPLVRGPSYASRAVGREQGEPLYVPLNGKYVKAGYRVEPRFRSSEMMWFPRLGDTRPDRVQAYQRWLGLRKGQKPTPVDNIRFFFSYQLGHMGWRYHAWNFVGRQNDLEGRGEPHRGNWITGINALDQGRVGDYRLWPSWMKANRAHNVLWGVPLLLGLLGMWYHYRTDRVGFAYVFAFFFMTGIALVVYLNNPPNEPRERDYTLVGAFYSFAVWLGLGVISLFEAIRRKGGKVLPARVAAAVLAVALPWWVASEEWDDHDRSDRYLVRDLAYNILMSCDSNAILIVNGDNSTYPVWYLQEVEGIRTDVRVVNYQLLGSEWYVSRLRKDAHGNDAIRFSFPEAGIRRGDYRVAIYRPMGASDRPMDLRKVLKMMASDDVRTKVVTSDGRRIPFYPTRRFFLPVDKQAALNSGLIRRQELPYAEDTVYFSISQRQLAPNALMMLDIIGSNLWKRPISVVISSGHVLMGLNDYARQRGLVYTITPIRKPKGMPGVGWVDLLESYRFLTEDFRWDRVGVDTTRWYGNVLRRQLSIFRSVYLRTAMAYLDAGDRAKAQKLAHIALSRRLPYMEPRLDLVSWVGLLYEVGDVEYARAVALETVRSFKETVQYFESLPQERQEWVQEDLRIARRALQMLESIAQRANDVAVLKSLRDE